jgi:transcriptional regulator with XRE-family HTH domain
MGIAKSFGIFFKQKRIERGLTLRELCRTYGFDAANVSRIERGLMAPPQTRETRLKYARALGIEEGNDDWLTFCDLAAISAGKMPNDMASDEEVLNALPILFRSVRRKSLDKKDLEKLVATVRRELR